MSITASSPIALAPPPNPPPVTARPARTWLVGPWFDLLFIANVAWPLVVLLAVSGLSAITGPLSIIQVYFLSTPHRWITLVLVFADRDHFWQNPRKFGGVAVGLISLGIMLAVAGTYAIDLYPGASHSLFLLAMVDYIWNAWHFAAQHAGISRIYGRTVRPGDSIAAMDFEKMAIRLLVIWAFCRLAIYYALRDGPASVGETLSGLLMVLPWIDPLVAIPALVLLGREIAAYKPQTRGRLLYLLSVISLYAGQVVALHVITPAGAEAVDRNSPWLLWLQALLIGAAVFHATEYLAIVSWSVQRKSAGAWRFLVPRWALCLAAFMVILGVTSWLMADPAMHSWVLGNLRGADPSTVKVEGGEHLIYAWLLINLLVSLLHYAYDGIIWRAKPAAKPAPV